MSPAETLSVLAALAIVALLYLYPPARAPTPSPRRRRARQNPPQTHQVGAAPVAVPPRRTVSRGLVIDVDALPGPSSSCAPRAGAVAGLPAPATAGPVVGPSQPTVVVGTATQLMTELGARAMSPVVHALVTMPEASEPAPPCTPTSGPSRLRSPPSAAINKYAIPVSPSSPLAAPLSFPSTEAGPSIPPVAAHPSSRVGLSTPARDIGEGSFGSKLEQHLQTGKSPISSPPILNGSPVSRVTREVTPRKSKAADKAKVVTYYWRSAALGVQPIQAPPDLTKLPELVYGDIFYHPMADTRFQLWLWTSNAAGRPYWKAIRYGYKRADGRRVVITPFYKVPGWVEKYDKVDHAMKAYDAYLG